MTDRELFNRYWSEPSRTGSMSPADAGQIADHVVSAVGWGSVLDIGCGAGELVAALCVRGMDARGIDVSDEAVSMAERLCPGRFSRGSVLALDLPSGSVDTVVAIHCFECLAEEDVAQALGEVFRVARKALCLRISTLGHAGQGWQVIRRDRSWWEGRLFEAGFRKHPRTYAVIHYDGLEHESDEIAIAMEKAPAGVLEAYPWAASSDPSQEPADMARESGRRSDARLMRYRVAADYIRPGDRVLDVDCGAGDGAHVMSMNAQEPQIVGIGASRNAIAYAGLAYGSATPNVAFRQGCLPDAIEDLGENSIDFIAGFDALARVDDPGRFLRACARALTPAGRLMVSIPFGGSDDGQDGHRSPPGLRGWTELIGGVETAALLPERAFVQSASPKTSDGAGSVAGREWRAVPVDEAPSQTGEWCVLLAMRDPVGGERVPYEDRLFPRPALARQPTLLAFKQEYRNPWLLKGMISTGWRMSDPGQLEAIADRVLAARHGSPDEAAALCVKAYRALAERRPAPAIAPLLERMKPSTDLPDPESAPPIAVRWAISLLYVQGLFALQFGDHDAAIDRLTRSAVLPFSRYGPLLATKTVSAAFQLGVLHQARHDRESARRWWRFGLEAARRAMQADWDESFGDLGAPPDFAMREMAEVMDLATRCASALSAFDGLPGSPAAIARVLHNSGSQIRHLGTALTAIRAAHLAAQAEAARLSMEAARVGADLACVSADRSRIQTDIERVSVEADSLRGDRDRLAAETADLRRQIEAGNAQHERATEPASPAAEADHLRDQLARLQSDKDRLAADSKQLRLAFAGASAERDRLAVDLNRARAALDAERARAHAEPGGDRQ